MWPLLLIAGAAVLLAGQVNAAVKNVEISPVRIQFQRSGITIRLVYFFEIYNPADVAATIDAVSGRIISAGTQIGTFLTREKISIAPRATTQGSASVRIDSLEAALQLYKAWTTGKIPTITIQGYLQTTLASVPFDYTLLVGKDLGLKKA